MAEKYSPDGITCGKCKWWFGGECRRHPPQMVLWPTDNQHPVFYVPSASLPNTAADHWCGDYQPATGGE